MSPTGNHGRPHRPGRTISVASMAPINPKSLRSFVFPLTVLNTIVLASAAQTEIAHYLNANVGYHQPYFTFYLTHITFALVFPLHLLFLLLFRPEPMCYYLDGIRHIIAVQLDHDSHAPWREISAVWCKKVMYLTMLVSVPALCWFVAMSLTTGLAVTTIYATSAFWTYLFSMILLKTPLSRTTVGSIGLAFAGVTVLSLDGLDGASEGAPNPIAGDVVMMIGALLLGLYEVVYKMALPEGHGGVASAPDPTLVYSALPTRLEDSHEIPTPPIQRSDSPPFASHAHPNARAYTRSDEEGDETNTIPLSPRIDRKTSRTLLLSPPSPPLDSSRHSLEPPLLQSASLRPAGTPVLPAALHANFLTSCIGLATFVILWLPMPLLHWVGWETFRWPGSQGGNLWQIWGGLQVVSWGGAIYNAGLMVLIGIWGPTTSSVANLLTIGLVAVIDAVWMGTVPSVQQLIGVGMICVGFGVLLWEGEG